MFGISNKLLHLQFYDFPFSDFQLCLDGEVFCNAYVLCSHVVIITSKYRTLVQKIKDYESFRVNIYPYTELVLKFGSFLLRVILNYNPFFVQNILGSRIKVMKFHYKSIYFTSLETLSKNKYIPELGLLKMRLCKNSSWFSVHGSCQIIIVLCKERSWEEGRKTLQMDGKQRQWFREEKGRLFFMLVFPTPLKSPSQMK